MPYHPGSGSGSENSALKKDIISIVLRRTECNVKKQRVKKYTPVTSCDKVPRELCAPVGCGFKQVEKNYSAVTLIRCRGSAVHLSAAASSR